MKRLLVVLLWMLLCTSAYSQQSTLESSESTNCFSDSEMEAFEAAVQAEVERASQAAVDLAVAPLYAEIASLRTQRNVWAGVAVSATMVCIVTALVAAFAHPLPVK